MSVLSLTTLASVRGLRAPTKSDVGKASPQAADAGEKPSTLDLLATSVPTELIAPYTAVMAAIAGADDDMKVLRWIVFAGLLLAVGFAVVFGAKRKAARAGGSTRFPVSELIAGLVAAGGWALALPESPLTPHLDGSMQSVAPPLVLFFTVGVLVAIGFQLKQPAPTPAPAGG